METSFWLRQDPDKPLFPDIEWSRPEQKSLAGRLLIVGGNTNGMVAVASAYQESLAAGVGSARVILPDSFAKTIPPNVTDTVFVPTNASGGISQDSLDQIKAGVAWSDATLLIGDSGRNSETAIVLEQVLQEFDKPFIITRDAVDLLKNSAELMLNRKQTTLVVSFAQLQKLLQAVYFPKQLLFSMQLAQVVDTLHKMTLSFECTLVTFHQEQIIVASEGKVITMPFGNPMSIWRGSVATKAAVYWLQHRNKPLEAIASSFCL
jgi:NAD(P)H-hydrate repair Nnr-like enzyme with NAD(P)H-hydrate dehydratase domain